MLVGPDNVAIHFNLRGEPDDWAPAHISALIMAGSCTLVFVIFFFIPYLIHKIPPRFINVPNKEYWMKPENKSKMYAMLSESCFKFGIATLTFFFFMELLALKANLEKPVHLLEDFFYWIFGFYMAYTLFWTVRIIQIFRIEETKPSPR